MAAAPLQPSIPALALEVWGADPARITATARRAEELGYAALYYGESPNGLNLEPWSMLSALAGRTTSLRLGPVISNLLPGYRSFALLVRQVHALVVLSSNRADLRTGTGASNRWAAPWWEPAGVRYPERPVRRQILDEWLAAYRQLWAAPGTPFR